MFTVTCILSFSDGQSATARIETASPEAESPISYSGAVERLSRRFETGDPADLQALFRNLARECGAELSVTTAGEYDRWAE